MSRNIKGYLSKSDYAELLGVSTRTVERMIERHEIKARYSTTGRVYIPESEIEKRFKPSYQNQGGEL